jgi:hypothetical protein
MPWTGPVFPTLPGITYPVKRSPNWRAVKQDGLSGKRTRLSLFTDPTYSFELPFSFLRSDSVNLEWQQLQGFINSLNGAVGLFGFTDPDDNSVSGQGFGEGDGTTLGPFQLVRALGGFAEPVFLLNGYPTIYVNGIVNTQWKIDAFGNVFFNSGNAPASGALLSWSGSYYWPCRFDEDTTDFSKFLNQIFELKSLKFTTEKLSGTSATTAPPSSGPTLDFSQPGNVELFPAI